MNLELIPESLNAEQAVIGGILGDAAALDRVGHLMPEHFFYEVHKLIFQAILDCSEAGDPIDTVTVFYRLEANGLGEEVGGLPALGEMALNTASTANIATYAAIVRDRATERRLLCAMHEIREAIASPMNVSEKLNLAQAKVMGIAEMESSDPQSVGALAQQFRTTLDRRAKGDDGGIKTGLADLDQKILMRPSDLIVIAGRPSMGKSALAFGIAENAAASGLSVLALSMEMSAPQLMDRIVSGVTRLPLADITSGKACGHSHIDGALAKIGRWNLHIDDTGGLSIMDVRAKARNVKRRHGLDLLLVDYLQLMTGSGEKRNDVIEDISRGLKALAKELDIPVIAVSQLNRKCEERTDKRPILSDLRDSGAVEQDADIVLFAYREEYYRPNATEFKGLAEILIRKNRQGATGDVKLTFLGQFARFENFSGNWPEMTRKPMRMVRGFGDD